VWWTSGFNFVDDMWSLRTMVKFVDLACFRATKCVIRVLRALNTRTGLDLRFQEGSWKVPVSRNFTILRSLTFELVCYFADQVE